jgi:hypothetical protein
VSDWHSSCSHVVRHEDRLNAWEQNLWPEGGAIMDRIRLWILILACGLSFAACTTFKQAALPPGQVATIMITDLNTGRFYNTHFVRIDGIEELPWVPFVRVAPGLHEVSFKYYSSLTRFEGQPITLTLDARGGHVYRIDGQAFEDRGRWIGWIIDDQTGEAVSGQRPLASSRP